MIMKQDKGRSIVIMDEHGYTEKFLEMLNTKRFSKMIIDPTKLREATIQRVVRKIKNKRTTQEYNRLYPTGSFPGKFYRTAETHKLISNDKVDQLPVRSIFSNIGTVTCNLTSYLLVIL